MKKLLSIQLCLAVFLAPMFCSADWHEFTSADGKKKVWAEVKGLDSSTNTVTLLLQTKKQIKAPTTAFSEADQAYIEKAGMALAAGRSLWFEFEDVENKVSEKRNPANGFQTLKLENGFEIEVLNNGKVDLKGLKAEYQIFYSGYESPLDDRPKKTDSVKLGAAGEFDLDARGRTKLKTDLVPMTSIKKLPRSECTGGT
ncbi:MAG: hypothetical protein HKN23_14250 [Verrucomicrobiales bacterium]|nr:hypothetical protein [Verrucomicrobiales bacterium]